MNPFEFIIDPEGKERRVRDIEIISHQVLDEESGEMVAARFVQVVVMGKHREWPNWYPLDTFKELNPEIQLPE